ncbi:hypothetical protein SVAN01_02234 [Stagonosporopsis vannaccii]|nr:hypothetical protein SVAN01_02234 [Stagonosporopsis vannaccii]
MPLTGVHVRAGPKSTGARVLAQPGLQLLADLDLHSKYRHPYCMLPDRTSLKPSLSPKPSPTAPIVNHAKATVHHCHLQSLYPYQPRGESFSSRDCNVVCGRRGYKCESETSAAATDKAQIAGAPVSASVRAFNRKCVRRCRSWRRHGCAMTAPERDAGSAFVRRSVPARLKLEA